MNLYLDYQKKISDCLKDLKKKKIIKLPDNLKSLTVEIPPKGKEGDMSSNAAMILAKINESSPLVFADVLKALFLKNFKEFDKVDVAGPGFLNIKFKINFWKNYLLKIIQSSRNYGSNKISKKSLLEWFIR